MFDIGFLELIIVSIVGLLVLGPDRLPGAIRSVSLTIGKLRRSFNGIRAEIERELKADEIRQELHNQSVMQELRNTEKELREGLGLDSINVGKDGYPLTEAAEKPAQAPGESASPEPPGDTRQAPDQSGGEPSDKPEENAEDPATEPRRP